MRTYVLSGILAISFTACINNNDIEKKEQASGPTVDEAFNQLQDKRFFSGWIITKGTDTAGYHDDSLWVDNYSISFKEISSGTILMTAVDSPRITSYGLHPIASPTSNCPSCVWFFRLYSAYQWESEATIIHNTALNKVVEINTKIRHTNGTLVLDQFFHLNEN